MAAKSYFMTFSFCISIVASIFTLLFCRVRRQHAGEVQRVAVAPQALQPIERAGLLIEHMDRHAAVVQQHPGAAAIALPVQEQMTK